MIKKNTSSVFLFTLAAMLLLLHVASASSSGRTQEKEDSPKVSEAEAKAINAFNAAADPGAKLTSAEEFVKKFPKSSLVPQVTRKVAVEIAKVSDPNQKLALADRFEKAFPADPSLVIVQSAKLDSLIALKRIDETFSLAGTLVAKNPEDLHTLMVTSFAGTDEAKRGNGKYLDVSQQYGLKAIEIIEAGKIPAGMDEATWTNHKAALAQLYQQTGILAMVNKKPDDAKARIAKAIALKPDEPSSHAILAYFINSEYVQLATDYKSMPEGKAKEEQLTKLQGMIDSIIDSYAHAVALATGKPEHQGLLQQVMPDLTSYYKYRHNGSTEGMQQLIDKYKPQPAKP
jgi:hypothetical protein